LKEELAAREGQGDRLGWATRFCVARQAKHASGGSTRVDENIPLYRNSEMAYASRNPAQRRGAYRFHEGEATRQSSGEMSRERAKVCLHSVIARSPCDEAIQAVSAERGAPDMRKRPWGAGAFCSRLGVGVVYISTWRLWGAGKEPREFLKLKSP
jgi:hypothetical protein